MYLHTAMRADGFEYKALGPKGTAKKGSRAEQIIRVSYFQPGGTYEVVRHFYFFLYTLRIPPNAHYEMFTTHKVSEYAFDHHVMITEIA